jgi:hypothetical protein
MLLCIAITATRHHPTFYNVHRRYAASPLDKQ